LIIFNAGTIVPLTENHPIIVTDTAEKLIVDQRDGAVHVEFVKGPTDEGRWIAGRDWVVEQARKLLLSAPTQVVESTQPAPAVVAKAEPMDVEVTPTIVVSTAPANGDAQNEVCRII
jgi:hypothetical protein